MIIMCILAFVASICKIYYIITRTWEKRVYPADKELQVESSIQKLGDRLLHVAKADVLELQGNTKVKIYIYIHIYISSIINN